MLAFFLFFLCLPSALAQTMPDAYRKSCAACHGESATGTGRGPGLIDSRSLRRRSESQIRALIRNGTRGGMPAFPLPDADLDLLARTVRGWNASAFDAKPVGE